MSIISLSTFATRLTVVEGGDVVDFDFHTKFRNAQLPAGVNPCDALNQDIDPDIINFFRQNFRYALLPDLPELPAAGLSKSALIAEISTANQLEIFNLTGSIITEVDIPQGATLVDVTPPEGVDPDLISSVLVQRVSGDEEVTVSSQYGTDSGNSRIYISTPPSSDGTHKLIITYGKR